MTDDEYPRCLNCGIRMRCYTRIPVAELIDNHKSILVLWTVKQLPEDGVICVKCLTHLKKCEGDDNPPRQMGHEEVCAACGNSVLRKRSKDFSIEQCSPFMIPGITEHQHYKTGKYKLCYPCQMRFMYRAKKKSEVSETNTDTKTSAPVEEDKDVFQLKKVYNTEVAKFEDDFLIFSEFKRFPSSRRRCLIPKCLASIRPLSRAKRMLLFLQTDIFICKRSSLCKYHQRFQNWPKRSYGIHNFTKIAVQDAIALCDKPVSIIDFDRINDMPDYLCQYWTGLTTDEFKDLYEKLNVNTSQYHSLRNALAIHLLRQKTGDNLIKLANLFLISTYTLSKQLMIIEKCFETYDSNQQNDESVLGTAKVLPIPKLNEGAMHTFS